MTYDDARPPALPTPEQILSALDRTGFVLEYRVAQKLRGLDFETFLNHVFIDPETGKSREIDVIASATENISDAGIKVLADATLIIECKNYNDPLIVIGENGRNFYNRDPIISFDPLLIEFANRHIKERGSDLVADLEMWRLPSHSTKGFIGSQLVKMSRKSGNWQAANEAVYDSIIYPLAKAADYEGAEVKALVDEDDKPWSRPALMYIFPVLVTAGSIFAVDVVPHGAPKVTSVQWVPLVRYFGKGGFLMDVVSFDHIEKYVEQRIFPTLNDARQTLASHMQIFNPEWLQHQYGESSDPVFMAWLEDFRSSSASQADSEIDLPPSS